MIRRCDPIPRRYTHFCGRSGAPGLGPHCSQMYVPDAFEDYWQDASVSIRSRHSWEASPSAWLDGSSSTNLSTEDVNGDSKSFSESGSPRIRSCRYSFESIDCLGSSTRGRRSFPPPLVSCSTLAIKEGGRFVLKEMDGDRPQGFFRAQRVDGRLLLQLVLPDEVDDEEADSDGVSDEDDAEKFSGDGEGEDECEKDSESKGDEENALYEEIDHVGDVDGEDSAVSVRSREDGESKGNASDHMECGCRDCTCTSFAVDGEALCVARPLGDGLRDSQPLPVEDKTSSTLRNTSKDVGFGVPDVHQGMASKNVSSSLGMTLHTEGGLVDQLSTMKLNQTVAEKCTVMGMEQSNVSALPQQESLWDVEVAGHAIANLSPWSSKQMCLHQSIVNMTPTLGLAM